MQILGRFVLLVIACSVLELHKEFLQVFLGTFVMDCASCLRFLFPGNEFSGFGLLVFGRFSHVFNVLGLVLVIGMGLKVLQFGLSNKGVLQFVCDAIGKSNDSNSKHELSEIYDSNIRKPGDHCKEFVKKDTNFEAKYAIEDVTDENEKECCPEDEEFDVMALRKLVKTERRRTKACYQELEKERLAASSAADEAMAMILRLQTEKSLVEMEASQFKRMVEQKHEYDQRVIESLQWIVMKHESERSSLEKQLLSCKQKLKLYMKDDELGQLELDAGLGFFQDSQEHGMENALLSSLETST
ncbi:Aldehyde dehydrogenase 6B2 [Hibiscus syriacus]|uniref:Aldehyde dehydrogenase 6B2 n=1 Tax=Hibiscus syriacus TaxID=106335 RepID=A0A6A3A3D2_HIBSY|nr:protein FLOURY 1-like [Hibiscus syriacus]KAE8698553.1 Aldehyde dehydrogenase 6B2 [Hibiscus syriacus]